MVLVHRYLLAFDILFFTGYTASSDQLAAMKVHEIMSKKVVTALPTASYRQLWQTTFKKRINALPVVDARQRILGIITREDLLQPLYPEYKEFTETFMSALDFEKMEERIHDLEPRKAKDIMCKRVIFTRYDTQVMRALSRMMVRRVNQLPVLDENNRVVGMITKGDIFYALFRRHLTVKGAQHAKKQIPKKRTRRK